MGRAEELISEIKKKRGYIDAWQAFLAKEDTDFMKAYEELYSLIWVRSMVLPQKIKELIIIGVLAVRGDEISLKAHMERALNLGASKEEIMETIETVLLPSGGYTLFKGMKTLQGVLKDKKT